jgi:hypothetical protein
VSPLALPSARVEPARGGVGRQRNSRRAGGGGTREKDRERRRRRTGLWHLNPFFLPLFSLTGWARNVRCPAQPASVSKPPTKTTKGVICTGLQSLGGSLPGLTVCVWGGGGWLSVPPSIVCGGM